MGELLLRAAAALAIVAGLIYFAGRLLRRAQAAGLIRAAAGERRIRVLETARLGPDSYIHLVQVDGLAVLVATGRGGVAVSQAHVPAAPDTPDTREVNA